MPRAVSYTTKDMRLAKLVRAASPYAIKKIVALIGHEDPHIALAAAKLILDRTVPIPRHNGSALALATAAGAVGGHLAAIQAAAQRRIAGDDARLIEAHTIPNGVKDVD